MRRNMRRKYILDDCKHRLFAEIMFVVVKLKWPIISAFFWWCVTKIHFTKHKTLFVNCMALDLKRRKVYQVCSSDICENWHIGNGGFLLICLLSLSSVMFDCCCYFNCWHCALNAIKTFIWHVWLPIRRACTWTSMNLTHFILNSHHFSSILMFL